MLIHPLRTEKITALGVERKYGFRVHPQENKIEIAREIERLYKIKVQKVAISWTKHKKRRVGGIQGRKAGFKKAIVTLKEGYTIKV